MIRFSMRNYIIKQRKRKASRILEQAEGKNDPFDHVLTPEEEKAEREEKNRDILYWQNKLDAERAEQTTNYTVEEVFEETEEAREEKWQEGKRAAHALNVLAAKYVLKRTSQHKRAILCFTCSPRVRSRARSVRRASRPTFSKAGSGGGGSGGDGESDQGDPPKHNPSVIPYSLLIQPNRFDYPWLVLGSCCMERGRAA